VVKGKHYLPSVVQDAQPRWVRRTLTGWDLHSKIGKHLPTGMLKYVCCDLAGFRGGVDDVNRGCVKVYIMYSG
jgi:hypothetical protein